MADVTVCEELAFVLAAARTLVWQPHTNQYGEPYYARKQAFARLRGTLFAYDERRAGR